MPPNHPADKRAAGPLTHADLIVRVDLRCRDLAGELIIAGRPTSTFTSWLGLLTALDGALDTLDIPSADTGGR